MNNKYFAYLGLTRVLERCSVSLCRPYRAQDFWGEGDGCRPLTAGLSGWSPMGCTPEATPQGWGSG